MQNNPIMNPEMQCNLKLNKLQQLLYPRYSCSNIYYNKLIQKNLPKVKLEKFPHTKLLWFLKLPTRLRKACELQRNISNFSFFVTLAECPC